MGSKRFPEGSNVSCIFPLLSTITDWIIALYTGQSLVRTPPEMGCDYVRYWHWRDVCLLGRVCPDVVIQYGLEAFHPPLVHYQSLVSQRFLCRAKPSD